MPDTKRQTSEDSSWCPPGETDKPDHCQPRPESLSLKVRVPAAGDPRSGARESPTLTGEELLDLRKAKATEEDTGYYPGDSHSDDQRHDAKGAWRQDRREQGHL